MASISVYIASSLLLLVCISFCTEDTDFYTLLDIEKDADNREIRKAFKKLALKMHPDKNTDDPDAHDKFLRLTRAYEVLKDEDLRKKYDEFGEEGLNDDFKGGRRRYESWKFYQQNFGIYDDDQEIITLSKTDFEQAVHNTEDIWFINFYSAHCSHCHELAPTWREVAIQLEGVVRIGAVNCEDDWMLCRQQSVRSYPSLLLYPKREKFQGSRSVESLVKAALAELKVKPFTLNSYNMESLTSGDKPWLITYCTEHDGDCLDTTDCIKLAAILNGLVSVGTVDCTRNTKLCEAAGADVSKTLYFPTSPTKTAQPLDIESLSTKEIAATVLKQLPEGKLLEEQDFRDMRSLLSKREGNPWLVHFTNGEETQIELKKLPAMLIGNINVGKVNCRYTSHLCNELHIHKFPTFAIFKLGGGFEIHYGRVGAHDVAAFARDCSTTGVEVLGPADFPQRVQHSQHLWFVDFFAPWCPPCMRLLPEFRKASKLIDVGVDVSFGTVDCTVHGGLCDSLGVRSYPTTLLFNNSVPHKFTGNHDAGSIIEFVKDVLDPPVINLTDEDFELKISGKSSKELWFVDYFAPWCGPCMQMMPEWRKFAKALRGKANVFVASIDCQIYPATCRQQGVNGYPMVRLYPIGWVGTSSQAEFQGWFRNAQAFMSWAQDYLPSKVITLNNQNFHKLVIKSKEPWVVDFYANWCGPCQQFASEYEKVAEVMEGKIKVGRIDCARFNVCQKAYVQGYPTLRFYKGADEGILDQDIFGKEVTYTGYARDTIADLNIKLTQLRINSNMINNVYRDEL